MKKEYDFSQGNYGLVAPMPPGKVRITIRIDADIMNWFRERVNAKGWWLIPDHDECGFAGLYPI